MDYFRAIKQEEHYQERNGELVVEDQGTPQMPTPVEQSERGPSNTGGQREQPCHGSGRSPVTVTTKVASVEK